MSNRRVILEVAPGWVGAALVLFVLFVALAHCQEATKADTNPHVGCRVNQNEGIGVRADWTVVGWTKNVYKYADREVVVARESTMEKAMKECAEWIRKTKEEISRTQKKVNP